MSLIELCGTGDVPEGESMLVEAEGLEVAVHNVDGEFFVTDEHCTHGPGSLSEGFLEGYEIECDFHGGRYDVRTGKVTSPPPWVPVRSYPVMLQGERVLIEVEEPSAAASG